MKEISQEEFEQYVRNIIEGIVTRVELQKRLHVDRITLNNKIQELYVYNPKLYMEFIQKFPYKPREYTHINYRAMIIDIMKKGYTQRQAVEQYEISARTILRKIHVLEQSDSELIELYRQVAHYRKAKLPLPAELQEKVNKLPEEEIFIGGIYDKRESELKQKEKEYCKSRMLGISDVKAYGSKKTIKDLSTLYRIEIEKSVQSGGREQSNFYQQLQVNVEPLAIDQMEMNMRLESEMEKE